LKKKNQKNFCLFWLWFAARLGSLRPQRSFGARLGGIASVREAEDAAPEKEPESLFPFDAGEPQRRHGETKSFFASFSLRGAFAGALSQKEESSLIA
jgi:hypothetical protein